MIPANALNKYLYYSGEQHGDQKRQATDFILRKNIYKLDRTEEEPGYHNFYYLQDRANTSFLREKLMHISEDP